jgi:outer membrane protein assembly factor BamB
MKKIERFGLLPAISASCILLTAAPCLLAGSALHLNGTSEFAVADSAIWPDSPTLRSFTIEAWIYPHIPQQGFIATDNAYALLLVTNLASQSFFTVGLYDSLGNLALVQIDNREIPINQWTHLAAMFDAATMRVTTATNGVLAAASPPFPAGAFYSDFGEHFAVGGYTDHFFGEVDEVRVSDFPRYTNHFVPVGTLSVDGHTKALFHFDDPPGSTYLSDAARHNYDLMRLNGAQTVTAVTPGDSGVVIITTHPETQAVTPGASALFSVTAAGLPPFGYQWRSNGVSLAGATNSTLSLTNAQTTNTTRFSVVVSNASGLETSRVATLVFKLWEFATGGGVYGSPALGPDGTVYAASKDGRLYAINPDGSQKWQFTAGSTNRSSPAIGNDGTVYFGSDDHKVYAINPSGTKKWEFLTGDMVYSSPAIAADGTIYVGSRDNKLYALNPNGTKKWEFATTGVVSSSPAVGPDGRIYFGSFDHNLYAVNPDGTEQWRFPASGSILSSPALGADGAVYFGARDHSFYALDSNGGLRWQLATMGEIDASPSIAVDNTLYVGSDDQYLYAITPGGTPRWQFRTGYLMESSVAVASDGTLYVGSYDNRFYAVNSDGTKKWEFWTGTNIFASPVLKSDGTIYAGSSDGKVYAFKDSAGLASTPWPMFRHDAWHTGRFASPATLRNPGLSSGQFRFDLAGGLGRGVRVDFSTNLSTWSPLTNLLVTNQLMRVSDPQISARRFYRAVEQ